MQWQYEAPLLPFVCTTGHVLPHIMLSSSVILSFSLDFVVS